MKKNISTLIFLLSIIGLYSCEEQEAYTPDERFVVQAYLYANEQVYDITLRNAVPLTVYDSVGEPINSGIVTLYKNDISYELVSSSDSGTYYYPGTDLNIETGDQFYIEAEVEGKIASGTTEVPESPVGVVISEDRIEIPEIVIDDGFNFSAMRELREIMRTIELEVYWENPMEELHFVVVENADEEQESIMPDIGGNFGQAGRKGAFRRISAPTRENSYEINFSEIQYWGKYNVKVYRVNQEYADLYENLEQDSRDLNEPPTNIKNGLGIFSAFHSMNVSFEVVKQ